MFYKKLMLIVFSLILSGFSLLSLIAAPKEEYPFSENENRYLEVFPEFSLETIGNKKFMDGFDKWTSDMFIGREQWINIKNHSERAVGKVEIAGVFTFDGRMVQSWSKPEFSESERNLEAINGFASRHASVPAYFMLAPNAIGIYNDTIPTIARTALIGDMESYISDCENFLKGITPISVSHSLNQNRDKYIFYRTDHHWTSFAAYLAYEEAARIMGFVAFNADDFEVERVSDDFRGTLFSKTLDSRIEPDAIDYYILKDKEPELTLEILGADGFTPHDSLYFREYLDKKDKYASFLGQNSPVMKIKTKLPVSSGNLLVFKDSFAHCLIPFLAKNYAEITILDMRYINVDYRQFVTVEDYDAVIFIYNAITFSEAPDVRKLNLGS
ncbi:MAG: DHHW family protein [Oscillospiraceae bacterium]|nr:DHHW family protein [Oscillospiraceae bacterium]